MLYAELYAVMCTVIILIQIVQLIVVAGRPVMCCLLLSITLIETISAVFFN